MKHNNISLCTLCNDTYSDSEMLHGELIRNGVQLLIKDDHPDWDSSKPVCFSCLNRYRSKYVSKILESQMGGLSEIEKEVVESLAQQESISTNLNERFAITLSFADHLSDKIASFGGSWVFISSFFLVLSGWILINSSIFNAAPVDPFPFILLNLILSCIAAIQAPIIMMSQNRQEAKDRLRSENDYRINLKAELEIRQLHIKIDQLLSHQWRGLMEVQQIQLEIMQEQKIQKGN